MNGEKKLVFDHYTTGFLGTLQNFDKVQVTGNSDLALDQALGNTVASLTVDAGSALRFNQDQGCLLYTSFHRFEKFFPVRDENVEWLPFTEPKPADYADSYVQVAMRCV